MLGAEDNMIRDMVIQLASRDPSFAKGVDAIERQLGATPIVPEDMDEAIKLLEFVLMHPDKYAEVREAAIKDGIIDERMVPPQYDQSFVVSMLLALYGLQDRLSQKMARGGLAFAARKIATGGQGGDTELVHVNRREKEMLRRMGGSGDINPNTGLQEYKSGKKIIGAVLPIALSVFLPGVGTAIGAALGASGVGASIVGGAIIGGASSALTGGDVLKGAVMGGLGGGLGSAVGGATSRALGLNLGQTGQAILGSGLVGAGVGAATGQNVLESAAQGVAGGALGELAGKLGGTSALRAGLSSAGRTSGQALTAGYDPQTAAAAGVASGLAAGLQYKPSDQVVKGLESDRASSSISGTNKAGEFQSPYDASGNRMIQLPNGEYTSVIPGTTGVDSMGRPVTYSVNPKTGSIEAVPQAGQFAYNQQTGNVEWQTPKPTFWEQATAGGPLASSPTGTAAPPSLTKTIVNNIPAIALAASTLGKDNTPPPEVQQGIAALSPQQQEYFNRPSVTWDWEKLQRDANAAKMSLAEYMAQNWNAVSSGVYNTTPIPQLPGTPKLAMGGGLNQVARFARGSGSGRADTINARLSDGEYVMDAETVAMLGDGSSDEGARRLDAMREQLRKHKGRALAKGKFSPNAKSPLSYIKGVA